MKINHRCKYIFLITAVVASTAFRLGPSTSPASAKSHDELTDTIIQIAKDEYQKHTSKWTDYEKQFTLKMTADQFAAYCIGVARYEHRQGRRWKIDWQARIPIYNPAGRLDSYDYGVMQINSRTGSTYFGALDYRNNVSDNIRAGVKHLAAGFNKAYAKGLDGREAINYGLQFYNPHESQRINRIWHYIPKTSQGPSHNVSVLLDEVK